MSAAERYRDILRAGWDGVEAWLAQEASEGLHLEFKRKHRDESNQSHSGPKANEADRAALAQAMSAFANSDAGGGVLVFGVHCKSVNRGPDVVQSINPIENLKAFQSSLTHNLYELTDPPIAGIQVEPITMPGEKDKGVLVIFIPDSFGGPHRVAKGIQRYSNQYFMRTDTGTIDVHHGLLASMFGRRPPASLYLTLHCTILPSRLKIDVHIGNDGRGYAERPAILFRYVPRDLISPYPHQGMWHMLQPANGWKHVVMDARFVSGAGCTFRADADTVLYSGMELPIAWLDEPLHSRDKFLLEVQGIVYALNMQPHPFRFAMEMPVPDGVMPIQRGWRIPLGRTDTPQGGGTPMEGIRPLY